MPESPVSLAANELDALLAEAGDDDAAPEPTADGPDPQPGVEAETSVDDGERAGGVAEAESPETPDPIEAEIPERRSSPGAPWLAIARGIGRVCAALGISLVVATLTILDRPFGRVSRTVKTMLGYVGIATLIVALATWAAGYLLIPS